MFSAINEEHKLIENEFDYRTFEETEKNERVAKGNENKKRKEAEKQQVILAREKMVPWPRSPVSVITISNFSALLALPT